MDACQVQGTNRTARTVRCTRVCVLPLLGTPCSRAEYYTPNIEEILIKNDDNVCVEKRRGGGVRHFGLPQTFFIVSVYHKRRQ